MLRLTIILLCFALVYGKKRPEGTKYGVSIEKYPYILSLISEDGYQGMAVLIKPDIAITVSRLQKYPYDWVRNFKNYTVGGGTSSPDSRNNQREAQNAQIANVCQNPKFRATHLYTILDVLRLNPPFTISNQVRPIALQPINAQISAESVVTMAGFKSPPQILPLKLRAILQEKNATRIDGAACGDTYSLGVEPKDGVTCFGRAGQVGVGGPLIVDGKLAGIRSYHSDYLGWSSPELFVNVTHPYIYNTIMSCIEKLQSPEVTMYNPEYLTCDNC